MTTTAPILPTTEPSNGELLQRAIAAGQHVTYQLQRRTCGKATCGKCNGDHLQGDRGHGPYWYAYFKVNGQLKSKYCGKKKPDMK